MTFRVEPLQKDANLRPLGVPESASHWMGGFQDDHVRAGGALTVTGSGPGTCLSGVPGFWMYADFRDNASGPTWAMSACFFNVGENLYQTRIIVPVPRKESDTPLLTSLARTGVFKEIALQTACTDGNINACLGVGEVYMAQQADWDASRYFGFACTRRGPFRF